MNKKSNERIMRVFTIVGYVEGHIALILKACAKPIK